DRRPAHPAGPDASVSAAGVPGADPDGPAPWPRGGDGPRARLRGRLVPRQRQARGQEGAHHRRGLGHRAGRRARLRPRGRRRRDLLPRRGGARRPGDGAGRRRLGPQGNKGAGGYSRRESLPGPRPEGRGRVRQDRRSGQQRRPPDDGRRDSRRLDRAARPDLQDQHLRHVLAGQGGLATHAGGRFDHQHLLHPGVPALAAPAAVREHEGRHHHVHQGARPGGRAVRSQGQLRGAWPGVDPDHTRLHARRHGRKLWGHVPHGPPGPASRTGPGLRLPRLPGGELRQRRDPRRHGRPTAAV
ncbi:hypothetical protein AVDCRST_MAG82-3624, partial [uncultured Rubrobacteraceae bacterium]